MNLHEQILNLNSSQRLELLEFLKELVTPKAPVRSDNSCNLHTDCDAAAFKARLDGVPWYINHCYDDCCEDCFGS